MKNKKIVILGAVAAGSKVAAKVKRDNPNFEVLVYTKDKDVSYSACGMPYYIGDIIEDISALKIRTVEEFESSGVKINLLCECVSVDFEKKIVLIKNLRTNEIFEDNYDVLVIATGAIPFIPQIEGINSDYVFSLRTLDDAMKIKEKAKKSKTVTIIGGGYIGIELIENFRRLDLKVNVIDNSSHIMNNLDENFSEIIQDYIQKKEDKFVSFYLNEAIERIEEIEGIFQGVRCKKAGLVKSDFVVLCVGIVPNTDFLVGSKLDLGEKNVIKVNEKMETNIKDVYACGDCADKHFLVTDSSLWVALGTTANKEGRIVVQNISGKEETFVGITASSVTKYYDFLISSVGLSEEKAQALGFETVSSFVVKEDKPAYMPNAKDIYFKLVVDKKTHKILGAQALGAMNGDKSISVVSSAILAGMTVEKLVDIDLSYAPPVSTTIDVLITACWNIKDKLYFMKN